MVVFHNIFLGQKERNSELSKVQRQQFQVGLQKRILIT